MVNLRMAILGACATFASVPLLAADVLELSKFDDELLPEPRVTAEAVFVGLVWPRLSEAGEANGSILAAIPGEMRLAGEVCVRVTTEDGRYSGDARYRKPTVVTSAMAILPYGPAKPGLSEYAEESIAVLAFPCSEGTNFTQVAVSSWRSNEDHHLGKTANLLINSFRADEAFLVVDGAAEVQCVPLDAGERAAFDYSCPLTISNIKRGASVSLFRVRGASMDPEVAIEIVGWE